MMPASEPVTSRCQHRGRIDAHFAGRIGLEAERSMRAHLGECASCHAYYERHLLLAKLRPRGGLSIEQRLGRPLGVRRRSSMRWIAPLAVAAAAAAVALILLPEKTVRYGSTPAPAAGFASRGAASSKLWIYRVTGKTRVGVARTYIAASDELAFSYDNGANKKYLLVFGVDQRRRVYWYHPAWNDASKNPRAIRIQPGGKQHELSEAIRHPIEGSSLLVFGVFTDVPLSVRQVEARVQRASALSALSFDGATTQRTQLAVRQEQR